jgi:hypothetical protein
MTEQTPTENRGGSSEEHWEGHKPSSDFSIKSIFGVIVGIVMIATWGISIGMMIERQNNTNANLARTDTRLEKLEVIVTEGMKLRIQLQEGVKNLQNSTDENGRKLDRIEGLVTNHILSEKPSRAEIDIGNGQIQDLKL